MLAGGWIAPGGGTAPRMHRRAGWARGGWSPGGWIAAVGSARGGHGSPWGGSAGDGQVPLGGRRWVGAVGGAPWGGRQACGPDGNEAEGCRMLSCPGQVCTPRHTKYGGRRMPAGGMDRWAMDQRRGIDRPGRDRRGRTTGGGSPRGGTAPGMDRRGQGDGAGAGGWRQGRGMAPGQERRASADERTNGRSGDRPIGRTAGRPYASPTAARSRASKKGRSSGGVGSSPVQSFGGWISTSGPIDAARDEHEGSAVHSSTAAPLV